MKLMFTHKNVQLDAQSLAHAKTTAKKQYVGTLVNTVSVSHLENKYSITQKSVVPCPIFRHPLRSTLRRAEACDADQSRVCTEHHHNVKYIKLFRFLSLF